MLLRVRLRMKISPRMSSAMKKLSQMAKLSRWGIFTSSSDPEVRLLYSRKFRSTLVCLVRKWTFLPKFLTSVSSSWREVIFGSDTHILTELSRGFPEKMMGF